MSGVVSVHHGNLQVKDAQALVDELESAHGEKDNFLALK